MFFQQKIFIVEKICCVRKNVSLRLMQKFIYLLHLVKIFIGKLKNNYLNFCKKSIQI